MRDRLVIFDCDGVLVDSEPLAALAYQRVYARHGMALETRTVMQCVGMKQADILSRIRDLSGHDLQADQAEDLWPETKAVFSEQLKATDGLVPFLERLPDLRCVASSSSLERIHHSLAVTGLAHHFGKDVFSSSMVARGKPAPDIFLFAARKMDVDPGFCIVIEDSPFGVEGAVAAGMTALGFVGASHTYPGHAEKLLAAGAQVICGTWTDVERELLGHGFMAGLPA
jgi:HAD superfamily hydrolase (TIGR01509 family)